MKTYTVYKFSVLSGQNHFPIEIRFKELVELEYMVKKDHPKIKLPNLYKTSWLTNHK